MIAFTCGAGRYAPGEAAYRGLVGEQKVPEAAVRTLLDGTRP
jgi:hypothetical protein